MPYANKKFSIFLQGSYGNDTNIFAESDVDIVIRLDDCFMSDLSKLTELEKSAYESAFAAATYTYNDFKQDVVSVLRSKYGGAVSVGNKAIAVDASDSRRKADVIVAIRFRRYLEFNLPNDSRYVEGICFLNGSGQWIANYPKQHSDNLTVKHQNTSERFKPLIRVFKNMRNRMIENGLIQRGLAPSYFIEGLLYNVPNKKFNSTYADCTENIFNWYFREASKKELVCANEQHNLFLDKTCWSQNDCDAFMRAAVKMWNEW